MDLEREKIVVTGGGGFLGSHLLERLSALGCEDVHAPTSSECDFTQAEAVADYYAATKPSLVMHLAARVGGIGANQKNPGRYFHDNLLMGVNVVEQGRLHDVAKTVLLGTVCSYPKHCPVPFREDDLWDGYPEETNAPYGVAKKALFTMAQAYADQYGTRTICLLPVNLYGPRDHFHLENSHVIPAMIRKCLEAAEAGAQTVQLWGDGTPTREFLYVDDCARGICMAASDYDDPAPVNLGYGRDISMRELATTIAEATGFEGTFDWDSSRPNGQPKRQLDTSRAQSAFGFTAETALAVGLAKTVAWYRENRNA